MQWSRSERKRRMESHIKLTCFKSEMPNNKQHLHDTRRCLLNIKSVAVQLRHARLFVLILTAKDSILVCT